MRAPESTAEVIRRLVALERIPMFADLPTIALATLARVAREVPAKAGEILATRSGSVLFAPNGVELVSPSRSVVDDHAPSLAVSLAGAGVPVESRARADGFVLEVSLAELAAALEDDVSLFLAISAAVARDAVEAGLTAPARRERDQRLELASEGDRDLLTDVLDLQVALPFARADVGSLFQLARHTAEVRAHDGVELWRAGDNTNLVLFPVRGALAVRAPTMARGRSRREARSRSPRR